jgi:hypothetical protein
MKSLADLSRAALVSRLILPAVFVALFSLFTSAQDYKFTVSTAQPWTDTGVDLQTGDVLAISVLSHSANGNTGCDPAGVSSSQAQNLPLASALPGALIARLQDNGSPMLVGANQELRVAQAGHLYLGANNGGAPVCQGSFAVRVHITSANSSASGTASPSVPAESLTGKNSDTKANTQAPPAGQTTSANGEKDVKDIKGALTTAAQTWLSGQLGMGANGGGSNSSAAASGTTDTKGAATSTTPPPELKISKSPLDAQLRKDIDSLPRRVNDQFQNQGDMVNFVIVGPLAKVQEALTAADWHVADRDVKESVLKAALETYQKKAYLAMPMSDLYLFGRVQDYGYEQAEAYAVVASRHHFRIWKAPFQWNGQDVWAGAGTHDIGFEKDQRNGSVTHKIDPAVDGERDNIGATLQKASKVKSMNYYLPPDPVMGAKNATGGGYHSNGQILVIQLQ